MIHAFQDRDSLEKLLKEEAERERFAEEFLLRKSGELFTAHLNIPKSCNG